MIGKIIHLRAHYHFGPHRIAMYLARYHDVTISPSSRQLPGSDSHRQATTSLPRSDHLRLISSKIDKAQRDIGDGAIDYKGGLPRAAHGDLTPTEFATTWASNQPKAA